MSVPLVVVGSVALDTIETPVEKRTDVLGGSVSYACAAASFFGGTGMVGVVGTDFPEAHVKAYGRMGIDTSGLQLAQGRTFRWSGVYEEDMNCRRTLSTELNVFADFRPELPASYRDCPFLFLANISPELQLHVLAQASSPRFVMADTMDLWINTARKALVEVISKVDMLTVNESELRLLTGEGNLIRGARKALGMGPRWVVVKKGEHGALLFAGTSVFLVPAYPVEALVDPTGAGDTFAGGFMGALARAADLSDKAVRGSMLYGAVLASIGVEAFGLDRLFALKPVEIEQRLRSLKAMVTV